jgi:hypothetical protein
MFVRLAAVNAEVECKTLPDDYDVLECEGMAEHLATVGHLQWVNYDVADVFCVSDEDPTPCDQD